MKTYSYFGKTLSICCLFGGLIAFVVSSCGSYQNSSYYDNDGVYGVYIHEGAALDFTLSLRNDDNERFGNHSTGSVAIGRDLTDSVRAWVSYGTAFKAPNLIDLYVDFPAFFCSSVFVNCSGLLSL